jgi:hypothetical protein
MCTVYTETTASGALNIKQSHLLAMPIDFHKFIAPKPASNVQLVFITFPLYNNTVFVGNRRN